MSKASTISKNRIPLFQKGAFGAGHFVLNILPGTLGVFIQFFLLTAFGMDPFLAGLLGGLPRIFDAVTDPIMGFISDNTKSRWGRRRPYIFAGAVISGLLFMVMWQLDEGNSQTFNFWYVLILQMLFLIGNTMFATPLVGLGYEMTPDYNERTRLMSFANSMGQIAWMIVPWLYVIIPDENLFATQAEGVRQMSLIVGTICIVFGVFPALFCHSSIEGSDDYKELSFSSLLANLKDLFQSIVQVSKNKPFMKICGATFLVFNGFQLVAAFGVFIIVFYMYNGSYAEAGTWPAWFNTINAIITAFIVIPIVARLANKFGKKNAFIISTFLSVVGYSLKWWGFDVTLNEQFNQTAFGQALNTGVGNIFAFLNPYLEQLGMSWFSIDASSGIPWLIFVPIPLFAFGMGGLFTIMMSMTADVCDLDELENGGPRKESTYGAIYWWMVKLGQAVALVLGGYVLKVVGFDQTLEQQTAETMTNLRIADMIIPATTALMAIFVMWKYDLDEERTNEIQEELARRKAPKPSGYSAYHIFGGKSILGLSKNELLHRFPHHYQIPVNVAGLKDHQLHTSFMEQLDSGIHGICLSIYRQNQNPGDRITEDQIRKRLEILKPYTEWIRVFSCTEGHELIPGIAKEMGFKTLVGAWISKDLASNEKEVASLIELINAGYVDQAAVGNEVLFRRDLSESKVIEYIQTVRNATDNTPISYVDVYYEINQRPAIINACDLIMINCYPFWEGADIDQADTYLQEMVAQTKNAAKGKQVILTETGWPSNGQKVGEAVPSPENFKKYFLHTQLFAAQSQTPTFYFSSFDESWKIHAEGWAGTAWGLWDNEETFKFEES
jgi:GPH family glycoside/pentoside/hexuronide:cation symporter